MPHGASTQTYPAPCDGATSHDDGWQIQLISGQRSAFSNTFVPKRTLVPGGNRALHSLKPTLNSDNALNGIQTCTPLLLAAFIAARLGGAPRAG